jgi:monoterpene epsilon-lactone hydrolase
MELSAARRHARPLLVAACVLLALGRQSLNEGRRAQHKDLPHLLLTLLYVVRKTVSVLLKRALGCADHPYWAPHEEIMVRSLAFAAKIGHCTAPRLIISAGESAQRGWARATGALHMQDLDFGLGGQGGRDALLIALDRKTTLAAGAKVVLFFHGGGYIIGSAGMYLAPQQRWLKQMKEAGGVDALILSVEYPLAPETKYPANLHFAARAYDYVVDRLGVSPSRIVMAGDSAGGAMAHFVARHAVEQRRHSLAGLVMISPWVNHSCASDSHAEHVHTDFVAGHEVLSDYSRAYVGDEHDPLQDHHISPIHGDVAFLPPTMITYGEREVFKSDIERFVAKTLKAERDVLVVSGPDMPHIYPLMYPLVFNAEAGKALDQIARFCVEKLILAHQRAPECR